MPEPINFMQNQEGLHRHPFDSIFETVRKYNGTMDNTGKNVKVKPGAL